MIACLVLLVIGREGYSHTNNKLRIASILGLISQTAAAYVAIRPYFKGMMRLIPVIASVLLLVFGILMQCWNYTSYLAAFAIYLGSSYCVVIHTMLVDYLDLVSRKMTLKEKSERRKMVKELKDGNEEEVVDLKMEPVKIGVRVRRLLAFFFKR